LSTVLKEDMSWLGPHQGESSGKPDTRICSHCGTETNAVYVYNDGEAFYCSQECLLKHFSEDEWNEYVDRTEAPEALEPGLAYFADYSGCLW